MRIPEPIPQYDLTMIYVPMWPIVAICAGVTALAGWRWRKLVVADRVGFCRACGYDVRASPERCPECGATRGATTGATTGAGTSQVSR